MPASTILYVDDEPDLLLLGKTFLEATGGFTIDTRLSAKEGLEALRTNRYDAVISDFQMPDMDGLVFLRQVRREFGAIPFILFTGRGREDVVISAINNGVDFYLQKGGEVKAQFAELAHKISMAIDRKRAIDEQAASEKQFSAIFHASPIHQMIMEFSTNRIIDINDRFLRDLRSSREEIIGRTTDEIGLMPDRERMATLKKELETSGFVRNAPVTVRGSTGTIYTSLASMTRVQVHGKDLVYIQSVDITPQNKAQQTINALLNAPPDVSMLFDTDGTILAVNHSASMRYNIPTGDLIGRDAFTLISPGFSPKHQKWFEVILRTGQPYSYTDDRTGHVYENHLYPIPDPQGNVTAIALYSHDATDEIKAKHALYESEGKYRLVVEHSHDAIYIYRNNRFLFINRQAERISGFSHDELMQRDIWDFIHPDDREPLKHQAMERFAGGTVSTNFTARIQKKDGGVRIGEFFVDLVEYKGAPAILGIVRDITEKKRSEEEIRDREEQLRSLADNLPNGMVYQILMRPDGSQKFVHVSAGVERLHEVSASAVLDNSSLIYDQIHPDDIQMLRNAEDTARKSLVPLIFELRVRTPSGTERWVLLRSAPRAIPDGSILWDGIELDITESRQAKEELKAAYEQLAASQEELQGQFETLRDGQEQLADSEEKYRMLVEHTGDGVFVAREGKFLFVNTTLANLLGYSPQELTGLQFSHMIAPEDRSMVLGRHESRLAGAAVADDYEFSILNKGEDKKFRVRIRAGTGRYQGRRAVIGTLHDVTEERLHEAALAESEARFRSLTEHSLDTIMLFDRNLRHIYVNPMAEKISGIPSDRFIGKTHEELGFPEHLVRIWQEHLQRVFTSGQTERIEFFLPTKEMWIDWILVPVTGAGGKVTEVITSARDITERKQVEEALRQSEELYRSILTASPDGICMLNLEGILTYASPRALAMFGITDKNEVIGTFVARWIVESDRPLARERFAEVQSRGTLANQVYRMVKKDGTVMDVDMHSALLHDENGTTKGIISIIRDITEQRRAEAALRESEENYRRIIEEMQDIFYHTDRDGIITMISTCGARLVGFNSADDIIGKYKAMDFYADPKEREEFLITLLREKTVSGYRITLTDRQGNLRSAIANSRVLIDNAGNMIGVEGILHDITHVLEVENTLRQVNRQLTLMTSITRHDISNQLLALNGWLELSRASVDDPERMLDLIDREQNIAGIISEQIEFTTFFDDMGAKPPHWQDVKILVEKSQAALPFAGVRLENTCLSTEVYADLLLGKVFYNILDNALRYGGGTMTRIHISSHHEGTGLIIAIEDDGRGIEDKNKIKIFQRGYGDNTGLGLFLVSEILAITGITIRETGTFGKGARFEICVPAGKFRDIPS